MNPIFSSLFSWFQKLPPVRRTLLTILLLCSGLLVVSWIYRPGGMPLTKHNSKDTKQMMDTEAMEGELTRQWERIKTMPKSSLAVPAPQAATNGIVDWAGPIAEKPAPYVAQAAEVAVATKEFKKSRSSLEEILDRHHAYAAKLRMVGQPSGSMLMATLRVPSTEFSAMVEDLKLLGSVEREEQTADEITAQRADLETRLRNAQNTLAKLKDMLQQGWKAGDPAEIQRQLSSVNAEIVRLQNEKITTDHRVLFSQVLFSLREEMVPPTESWGSQFRAAVMAGVSDGLNNLSGILFFVVSRGPAILLWVVLLYFPSRWLWRKWHNLPSGVAQGA